MTPTSRIHTARPMWRGSNPAQVERTLTSEEARLLVENKYTVIAAVAAFLLTLSLTDGSIIRIPALGQGALPSARSRLMAAKISARCVKA
jgi:hypothetical protein